MGFIIALERTDFMAKKSVKLEICGVSVSLLTEESPSYMTELAKETEEMMTNILRSPAATVERAAVAAALSFLDDSKKKDQELQKLENKDEMKGRLNDLEKKLDDSMKKIKELEKERDLLKDEIKKTKDAVKDEKIINSVINTSERPADPEKHNKPEGKGYNPMRPIDKYDQQGMVDFFEKK
jgi:cell division protein ZapA (FtsZ GTPase activity inhibitor)